MQVFVSIKRFLLRRARVRIKNQTKPKKDGHALVSSKARAPNEARSPKEARSPNVARSPNEARSPNDLL